MPFSSQPRKKGNTGPQAGTTPSCGHSPTSSGKKTKPVDVAVEKKVIADLQDKISEKIRKEPKGADKAAFILSSWINPKRK